METVLSNVFNTKASRWVQGVALGLALVFVPVSASFANPVLNGKGTTQTIKMDLTQWDPVNLFRTSFNQPFDVNVKIRVTGNKVTLTLPDISFNLAVAGVPVQGFVYTVPGFNLPKSIWPTQLLGKRFVVNGQGSAKYSVTVGTDGALTISAPDATLSPIPAISGIQKMKSATITYDLPPNTPKIPKNVRMSNGSSNIIGSTDDISGRDYLDYYANDIQKDKNTGVVRAAFVWADNSAGGSLPRNSLALMVKTATVNSHNGKVTYGPTVQATFPAANEYHVEAKVAINPTNVNNIVALASQRVVDSTGATIKKNMLAVSSFDGGLTWSTPVTPPWSDAEEPGDPWVVFDKFGNCFISAIVNIIPATPALPAAYAIRNSTDGGRTFPNSVAYIPTVDIVGGGFPDFPKMSIGPDGSGAANKLALWFSFDDADFTQGVVHPGAGFVKVTGLGAFTTPTVVRSLNEIPQGAGGIGLSQILVNPVSGAVYFFSTNVNDFSGFANSNSDANLVSVWVNPTGTVGFNSASFLPKRDIIINNMGINSTGGTTTHFLPWAPARGVGGNGVAPAGYDATRGRLWYAGIDMRPALTNQNVIPLVYSDDEGLTWSDQFLVNEVQTVPVGMSTIAVEPNTGIMAAGWYDPRFDPINQQSVDYFGFVIQPPFK